jgi:hypothetical protein
MHEALSGVGNVLSSFPKNGDSRVVSNKSFLLHHSIWIRSPLGNIWSGKKVSLSPRFDGLPSPSSDDSWGNPFDEITNPLLLPLFFLFSNTSDLKGVFEKGEKRP